MNRKKLTAALLSFAMAVTGLGANTGLATKANDGGVEFALGDTNGDHKVDATDASEVLSEYARLSTSGTGFFTGTRKTAADVDGNGKIDSNDASAILRYYSYLSTGGDMELKAFLSGGQPAETTTTTTASTTSASTTATTTATTATTSASASKQTSATTTSTAKPTTTTTTTTTSTTATAKPTSAATTTTTAASTTTTTSTTAAPTTTTTTTTTSTTATTASTTATTTTTRDPGKVAEIRLSQTECTVEVGQGTLAARVTMFPLTAADQREIWTSSDESIAVVDNEGWVIGKKEGSCTITVKSAADPTVSADIKLTVTDSKKVTGIRLSRTEFTMAAGTGELSARVTMLPAAATDLREEWSSSNESVAVVDSEGWVMARAPGKCTITVKSVNNPNVKATIELTVTGAAVSTASTSATTTSTTSTSTAASTTTESATTTTTTSSTTTASTTSTTATTTTTTTDSRRVSAIKLSVTAIELSVGELGISYVTMLPDTAVNKGEIWYSSDTNVATVDIYGNIRAVGVGKCTVTVKSSDNPNVTADVSVNVLPADRVRKIELTKTEMTIEYGAKDISYVTMLPATAKNKDEIWVCSDTNIAIVDKYGWVTGRGIGECTVTVYSVDNPAVKAEIKVNVVLPPEPPAPVYPESRIIHNTLEDGRIAFCTPFPDDAKGHFSVEYVISYENDYKTTNRTSVLTVPAIKDYTAYFRKDLGDFSVSAYLFNEDNGCRARIGTYEFKVAPVDCKTTIEDIRYAFYLVDGLAQ